MPAVTPPPAAAPAESRSRRIVVTVGTDHHPFDRLIRWTNEWLGTAGDLAGGCFVQWGASAERPACPGAQYLEVGELTALLNNADVIVCHGGPASMWEAWTRDLIPIVVPRLSRLGEHVDDHQAEFCDRISALGRIALAPTLTEFTQLLARATQDPSSLTARNSASDVAEVADRLGDLVEELVSRPRRISLISRGRRPHRDPAAGTGVLAGPGGASPGLPPVTSTNWQAARESVRIGLAATVIEEHE